MMKKLLAIYRRGVDFYAFVLYALLFLPYLVYWCLPAFSGLDCGGVSVSAHVFCALAAIPLIFIVKKEKEKKPLFDTAFTTLSMLVLLYYAAFIIYFCGKINFAVTFFVMISPALSMLVMAIERKNVFSIPFGAICLILSIASALIVGFSM